MVNSDAFHVRVSVRPRIRVWIRPVTDGAGEGLVSYQNENRTPKRSVSVSGESVRAVCSMVPVK